MTCSDAWVYDNKTWPENPEFLTVFCSSFVIQSKQSFFCRYAEVNHIEMLIVLCSRVSYRKEMFFDRINPEGKRN